MDKSNTLPVLNPCFCNSMPILGRDDTNLCWQIKCPNPNCNRKGSIETEIQHAANSWNQHTPKVTK